MLRHLSRGRILYLALAVTLLGFGLRVYRLDNKNLWYDEGFSVFMARQPLTELPEETALDVHPPFYFALLHGWRAIAGESAYALRFPSALAGVLTLAVAYRVGRRHLSAGSGLAAAALLAIHRPSLWYSQEVRMYAPVMLLAVLALWAMLTYLERGGWRAWLAYVAAIATGLHTLYLFVLAPVALGAAGLLALGWAPGPGHGRRAWGWVGAQAIAALSLIPWLLYALPRRPERYSEAQPIGLIEVIGLWLNTFLVGASPDPTAAWADWPVYLLALGCLALALAIAWPLRRRPSLAQFGLALSAGLGAALTIGLIWGLNQPWDFQLTFAPTPRYLVGLVPWALIALGGALATIVTRWRIPGLALAAGLLLSLAASSQIYYTDRYASDTFQSAASTLNAYRQPNDGLLLHNNREWPIVDYYLGGQPRSDVPFEVFVGDDATAARFAQPVWDAHDAVWLLLTRESLISDYEHRVFGWLQTRAVASRRWDYGPNAELWLFARTDERAAMLDRVRMDDTPPPLAGLPGYSLERIERALPETRVGEMLRLFLTWRVEATGAAPGLGLRLSSVFGGTADEIPLTLPAPGSGVVRQQVDFPIRPYVGVGRYMLQLTDSLGGAPLGPPLTEVEITASWPLPATGAALAQSSAILFENGLAIRSWEASSAGGRLRVALDWEVTRLADRRYKLFVHLLGPAPERRRVAQGDAEPLGGFPPFTAWPLGARVPDALTLQLPADLAGGTYTLVTGLYDPITGTRLPVITTTGAVLGDVAEFGTITLP